MVVYLDASALVKLVVREPESGALHRFLALHPIRVSCALARTEVPRAVRHLGPEAVTHARALLATLRLVRLDEVLLDAAADLSDPLLRSLDALHLAAARTLADELQFVVTYDRRMHDAATRLGLRVHEPV